MKRCRLDKISAVTTRLRLKRSVVLGDDIPARAGTVVACRVASLKTSGYRYLEDVHGRLMALHPGDIMVGALGHRDALHGYSGVVPDRVSVGDELQLLGRGGVVGTGAVASPGVGEPILLEVLGSVLHFPEVDHRVGIPATIGQSAHPLRSCPVELPPVVALCGTSMNSGKTTAASTLISGLCRRGSRVAAGKLTGVSSRQDVLEMSDCGADPVSVFTDFGVVTTHADNVVPAAHAMLAQLAESEPGLIVLEMGDGLLGTYGVHALFADDTLRQALRALVLCAYDPVGAWGGHELLQRRYGLTPQLVSGPVTDSPAGCGYIERELGVPAWNALRDGASLPSALQGALLTSGGVA